MDNPAWFRDLLPASFAGVDFQVLSHNRSGGRRGPDHEYPQRDEAAPEDMGERLNRYTFDAFVIGDEAHRDAFKLIGALTDGVGELIHPRFGAFDAICRDWTSGETLAQGGYVSFALTFVPTSKVGLEIWEPEISLIGTPANLLAGAALEAFSSAFTVAGSGFVASAALASISLALDVLEAAVRTPLSSELGVSSDFVDAVAGLRADAVTLVSDPDALGLALAGAVGAVGDLGSLTKYLKTRPAQTINTEADLPDNPNEAAVILNDTALNSLLYRKGLAEAATQAEGWGFGTYDEAITSRDTLATLIYDEENTLLTAAEYSPLAALRGALSAVLTERADSLVRLRDLQTQRVTSVLEMAWDLYGDAERADEILDLNGIKHGGFVAPGTYRVLAE